MPTRLPTPANHSLSRNPSHMNTLTAQQAATAIEAARAKADEIGVPMNIAVVDAGANLKGFLRMDEAWLGSIDISIRKAQTARYFDMPTVCFRGGCLTDHSATFDAPATSGRVTALGLCLGSKYDVSIRAQANGQWGPWSPSTRITL